MPRWRDGEHKNQCKLNEEKIKKEAMRKPIEEGKEETVKNEAMRRPIEEGYCFASPLTVSTAKSPGNHATVYEEGYCCI